MNEFYVISVVDINKSIGISSVHTHSTSVRLSKKAFLRNGTKLGLGELEGV